ncbi:MAG: MGH1-like glycoside hydrolase domain-containing protein [Vulcanimicrobiaceae bacterium]
MDSNPERARVEADALRSEHWTHWGPYLSARQWGTVREDYSADGSAWTSFPFEDARLRAYRWGEDGIFGISDDHGRLCFAPAFWNEADPILKERFFGLSGPQGNHGEDVKEYYYFLDNVPSHAYMKALYKYPQAPFPYAQLVAENARRTRAEPEYELVDTGIFADGAYFDVLVEYAKAAPDDFLVRIAATNRGRRPAPLHIVPQLWFRNTWSWAPGAARPVLALASDASNVLRAVHPELGSYHLYHDGTAEPLFCENETNFEALFGVPNPRPFPKDAIDRAIVGGERGATNPALCGTKAALHAAVVVGAGQTKVLKLRLSPQAGLVEPLGPLFDALLAERADEAERFYRALDPFPVDQELRAIQRRAFAGLLWSKQYYGYVVRDWLRGDPLQPPPPAQRRSGRNHDWLHLYNDDVLSMPDTWEYPWYAAWDLAFHTLVLALVDPGSAKRQLLALTREWYMHPNGQLPAYEWNFSDVNPPVHAWAAYRIFQIERKRHGVADYLFLERVFQKLLMNFTWWVNREDPQGTNVFMGGFLGLDNIGPFDRSAPLPGGAHLLQSDATAWMAIYALDMMAIALELTAHDASYEDIASKFFEHFLYIASAINDPDDGGCGLWDEVDGFYYDRLVFPDERTIPLRVRSYVGLLPLLAVQAVPAELAERVPNFRRRVRWFVEHRPELHRNVAPLERAGVGGRRLLAVVDAERLVRLLQAMLDPAEFLSPFGIRSLSKIHEEHPFTLALDGMSFRVDYEPGESTSGTFGGNSNWRGPLWFPCLYLVIEALQSFHFYYGDDLSVEYPTGSGERRTLWEVATDLSQRAVALFRRAANGERPCDGEVALFRDDPHFRDLLLFSEFFHGDSGKGLGASHQTGWTALVAKLVQQLGEYEAAGASPLAWQAPALPPPR